jgi:hypothetical protein
LKLTTSDYVLSEVAINLAALPSDAAGEWAQVRVKLARVADVLTSEWATVFAPTKDRPILLTAAAWANLLLTLDRRDFGNLLGGAFYGLTITKPGDLLEGEHAARRMKSFRDLLSIRG